MPKFSNQDESMTLRKARRLASREELEGSFGYHYASVRKEGDSQRLLLPQLRRTGGPNWAVSGDAYKSRAEYLKTVDRLITKYGPDAEFRCSSRKDDYTDEPTNKGGQDDGLTKESADTDDAGSSEALTEEASKQAGQPAESGSDKGSAGEEGDSGSGTGTASADGTEGTKQGGPSNPSKPNPSRGQTKPQDGEATGRRQPSEPGGQAASANSQDQQDRHDGQGSDSEVDHPESTGLDNSSDGEFGDDARYDGFPSVKQVAEMMDALAHHHPYGELMGSETSYRDGSDSPAPSASDALKEFKAADEGIDLSGVKVNEGPGGVTTDMLKNDVFHGEEVFSDIRKIRPVMDRLFKELEVGTFGGAIPKVDPHKLVKELVGKSYRLGRCAVEGLETGIKLMLVDNSGSCHRICGPAMAAAIEIAKDDPDVVIYVHSNGYYQEMHEMASFVGTRSSEVRFFSKYCNRSIREALDSGDAPIAGIVAFGDWDAESLYQGICESDTPFIWIDPSRDKAMTDPFYSWVEEGCTYVPCNAPNDGYQGFSVGKILRGLDEAVRG
jgi:hypothetical protein